jgi:hypothetical protein
LTRNRRSQRLLLDRIPTHPASSICMPSLWVPASAGGAARAREPANLQPIQRPALVPSRQHRARDAGSRPRCQAARKTR